MRLPLLLLTLLLAAAVHRSSSSPLPTTSTFVAENDGSDVITTPSSETVIIIRPLPSKLQDSQEEVLVTVEADNYGTTIVYKRLLNKDHIFVNGKSVKTVFKGVKFAASGTAATGNE